MSKYSESLENLRTIIETFRLDKMQEDIKNMEELLKHFQSSRKIACKILKGVPLQSTEYHLAEDYLTKCIEGVNPSLPWQLTDNWFKIYLLNLIYDNDLIDYELSEEQIDDVIKDIIRDDDLFDMIHSKVLAYTYKHYTQQEENLFNK